MTRINIDDDIPIITLFRALANGGLVVRSVNGEMCITSQEFACPYEAKRHAESKGPGYCVTAGIHRAFAVRRV